MTVKLTEVPKVKNWSHSLNPEESVNMAAGKETDAPPERLAPPRAASVVKPEMAALLLPRLSSPSIKSKANDAAVPDKADVSMETESVVACAVPATASSRKANKRMDRFTGG